MNVRVNEVEEEIFTIGDVIVPYSNIEITHANDNKAPMKFQLVRIVIWLAFIALGVAVALS